MIGARSFGHRDLEEFRTRLEELRGEANPSTAPGAYVAYTDGACLGNPQGPGGWAAVIDRPTDGPPWMLYGHLSSTSNNRAEALGVLAVLEWLPPRSQLELHSDSELTVRILQGRYKAKANSDIWQLIQRAIAEKQLKLNPEWVRGHAGDPRNELADRLSKLGALNGRPDALEYDIEVAPAEAPPELAGLEPRTEWERDFVSSVAQQLRRGRSLTAKQQSIVDRMRAR